MSTPAEATLSWPTIALAEVFHLGVLDSALKGRTHNSTSQEGNGLSVSLDPDAWRRIAKLGGNPLWALRWPTEALFLDHHALEESHWATILEWAQARGLVEPTELIEVSWIDGETEERVAMRFDASDPKEAAAASLEYEGRCAEDEDAESAVRLQRLQGWKATPAMNERIGFPVDVFDARSLACTLYVEDVLFDRHGLQGVWWDDELDPGAYSAPRGVIHLRALDAWEREQLDQPENEAFRCRLGG